MAGDPDVCLTECLRLLLVLDEEAVMLHRLSVPVLVVDPAFPTLQDARRLANVVRPIQLLCYCVSESLSGHPRLRLRSLPPSCDPRFLGGGVCSVHPL